MKKTFKLQILGLFLIGTSINALQQYPSDIQLTKETTEATKQRERDPRYVALAHIFAQLAILSAAIASKSPIKAIPLQLAAGAVGFTQISLLKRKIDSAEKTVLNLKKMQIYLNNYIYDPLFFLSAIGNDPTGANAEKFLKFLDAIETELKQNLAGQSASEDPMRMELIDKTVDFFNDLKFVVKSYNNERRSHVIVDIKRFTQFVYGSKEKIKMSAKTLQDAISRRIPEIEQYEFKLDKALTELQKRGATLTTQGKWKKSPYQEEEKYFTPEEPTEHEGELFYEAPSVEGVPYSELD